MILSFKTEINEKPTFFVEKILKKFEKTEFFYNKNDYMQESQIIDIQYLLFEAIPKIHTIRVDKNDRWRAGRQIDFYINARTEDMFRFAPKVPVVSIQKIEIIYDKNFGKSIFPSIIIDGNKLHPEKVDELAQNDGFDTVEEFLQFFNEDFSGKIIHWTDLKY
jgi:hypothetical protein